MRIDILIFLLSSLLYSCKETTTKKEININNLISLTVPSEFSLVGTGGIDSYTFKVSNKKGNTFSGDLGQYTNLIINPPIVVFDINLKDSIVKQLGKNYDSTVLFFSEDPDEDAKQNIFSAQYYMYDTINGIRLKIIQPKKFGNGIAAIYAPRLKNGMKLTIYTENVDSSNLKIAMDILKSIKYIK
jgi:hypothetical protein